MKALTIRQPWAALIALGIKTIETRSWKPPRSAIGQPLAIHAGKGVDDTFSGGGWWVGGGPRLGRGVPRFLWGPLNDSGCDVEAKCVGHPATAHVRSLTFGAVVATCTLADVVPMRATTDPPEGWESDENPSAWLGVSDGVLFLHRAPLPYGSDGEYVTDQLPYGDYTPGRFAWLLDQIEPVDTPVPAKGRQGLWEWSS